MQQKYVVTMAVSACVLAWQLWEAEGDFYLKYSLLQIPCAFGTYICIVVTMCEIIWYVMLHNSATSFP